jgi:hypothetical protein
MKKSIRIAFIIAMSLLLLSSQSSIARAQGVKAGVLTCRVAAGFGYIVGSSRIIRCTYSSKPGSSEDYLGTLSIIGLDIGYIASATLVWAVFAPTEDMGIGALAGNYAGASARATAGLGVGVNVMTGFQNSIMLQPVSVEGSSGLYVGLGVGSMSLEPNLQDYY